MTSLRCSSKNRDQISQTGFSVFFYPTHHQYFVHSFLIQFIPSVCHFISCYTFRRYKLKLLYLNLIAGIFQNFPWISELSHLSFISGGRLCDMDVVFPTMRHCNITHHSKTRKDLGYIKISSV